MKINKKLLVKALIIYAILFFCIFLPLAALGFTGIISGTFFYGGIFLLCNTLIYLFDGKIIKVEESHENNEKNE